MKVLVFGASGMIGSAMFRVLSEKKEWQVWGTLRADSAKRFFSEALIGKLLANVNVDSHDALVRVFLSLSAREQKGREILAPLNMNGFFPANDHLYDGVRAAAAAVAPDGPQ